MRLWLCLFLAFLPALAQGEGKYLVGRILALREEPKVAVVEAEGRRLEALLPVDGGQYRVGQRVVLYQEGGRTYVTEPDRMPCFLAFWAYSPSWPLFWGAARGCGGLLAPFLAFWWWCTGWFPGWPRGEILSFLPFWEAWGSSSLPSTWSTG